MKHRVRSKQSGAVLVVSLVLLIIMVIIGLSTIRTSLMEEKMASNTRDMNIAFQAAETALRDAELWLMSQATDPLPTEDGNNRIWDSESALLDPTSNNSLQWWQETTRTITWWQNNAVVYAGNINNVNSQPMTIIEYVDDISDDQVRQDGNVDTGRSFYRITARASGGSANARVLVQSTVAKRY